MSSVWNHTPPQPNRYHFGVESPTSDGTRLSNNATGNIVLPGGASITQVADTAGTYTFLCKLHSHKGTDAWEGMVGKVTVAAGGGTTPGSGVDYTEYRVNTNGATGDTVVNVPANTLTIVTGTLLIASVVGPNVVAATRRRLRQRRTAPPVAGVQ